MDLVECRWLWWLTRLRDGSRGHDITRFYWIKAKVKEEKRRKAGFQIRAKLETGVKSKKKAEFALFANLSLLLKPTILDYIVFSRIKLNAKFEKEVFL